MPVPIPPLSLGFSSPSTAISGQGDFSTQRNAPLIQNGPNIGNAVTVGALIIGGAIIITRTSTRKRRKR